MKTEPHRAPRPSSAIAQNKVRDIIKRRDKPFKVEQGIALAKEKKPRFFTSYESAPAGYVFLPYGTPDLADLCQKLSQERNYAVNHVHAKPWNPAVKNPDKISFHIQRIGYHFRTDVVEDAVAQLKYRVLGGKYIKEADIKKKEGKNLLNEFMERRGLTLQIKPESESSEQAAAVIKEIFPEIPDWDLQQIVAHAWAEGSSRVGTAHDLDLARRVQLAVCARIRHKYTDYDHLLKAFDWRRARQEVEPSCLAKLVEWRGSAEDIEPMSLEEAVGYLIVDNEEDDAPRLKHNPSQRPQTPGEATDTSMEIVYRAAVATDPRTEYPREQQFFDNQIQVWRTTAERDDVARVKVDAFHDGQMQAQTVQNHHPHSTITPQVTRVNIDGREGLPTEILVDGVLMRRAFSPAQPPIMAHTLPTMPPAMPYTYMQSIPFSEHPDTNAGYQGQPHAQPAINMSDFRVENFVPRHGQPAHLQYRRLNDSAHQSNIHHSGHPQFIETAPPQEVRPPFHHSALPQSLLPNMQLQPPIASSYPLQLFPLPTQQYTAYPQTMPVYRPIHGAPAPVQPATSSVPLEDTRRYWHER